MDPDQATPMVDDARLGRRCGASRARNRGRRRGIVLATLLAAGLVAVPTAAMGAEQPDLCGEATALTGAGYPQQALAMLTAAQGKSDVVPCEEARDAALVTVAEAERLALDGKVTDALAVDAENATALAASQPQTAAKFWLGVAKALDSGIALLLAIAGMALVLAVAARWVTTWALPWPTLEPRRSGTLALSGAILVVVGASASLALIRSDRGLSGAAVFWFMVALVGVGVLAVGLATRLRIAVVATDAIAGHVIALLGELGARPPEGMEVPRGADVETLGGGALDSLPETALAKAVTALVRTVLGLTPWRVLVDEVPGAGVAVAMTRNGRGVGAVLIEPEVLGLPAATDEEKKQVEKADLYRLVAAFVMVTLQRYHRGFDGLCGARDWRSLGLQYIATTDFMKDEDRKKVLLVRAENLDPGNWLAQVALASSRWRESTDPQEIGLYLRWLDAAIPRRTRLKVPKYVSTPTWPHSDGGAALAKNDASSLLMRLFLTRAKVAINYYWATGGADTDVGDEERRWAVVTTAVADLRKNVDRATARKAPRSRADSPTVLADAIEAEALELERLCTKRLDSAGNESQPVQRPGPAALALMCPDLRYSEGCTAASQAEWLTLHALRLKAAAKGEASRTAEATAARARRRAAALLGDAAIDGESRAWMSKDPQLAALRGWKEAKDLRPKQEKDLFALDLYTAHKKRFDELGIRYPADLVGLRDRDLARRLKVTRPAARRLIEVARVHEEHPAGTTLGDYRVELLRTILAKGPGVTAADVIKDVRERMWLRADEVKNADVSPQIDLAPPITRWIRRVLP